MDEMTFMQNKNTMVIELNAQDLFFIPAKNSPRDHECSHSNNNDKNKKNQRCLSSLRFLVMFQERNTNDGPRGVSV